MRIVKPNGLILISVWALEQNIGDDGAEKRQSETVSGFSDTVIFFSFTLFIYVPTVMGANAGPRAFMLLRKLLCL